METKRSQKSKGNSQFGKAESKLKSNVILNLFQDFVLQERRCRDEFGMTMIMKARVFISGFVQGIGFRQFVKNNAQKLNLKGWVKNLPDGRVEAVLQGGREDIEKVILLCRKGTFLSEVKNVEVIWEEEEEKFEGFEIRH